MDSVTEEEFYNLGAASISITPEPGVALYALDGAIRTSDNLNSELMANSIVIRHDKELLVIVSLDLIWVDKEFTERVRAWINLEYKNSKIHLLLVATHSHSTPQISNKICNFARPESSYLSFLYNQVCRVIDSALNNQDQCYAELSIAYPDLTVNRRKSILSLSALKHGIFKSIIANRPNYRKAHDNSLYTVWFYDSKKREKAVILNYACHPTLFRKNFVSADFPGVVSNYLKRQLSEGVVVCFLQGFSGNIKANFIKSPCINYSGLLSYVYSCIFDRVQFNKNISQEQLNSFSIKLAKIALERSNPKHVKPQLSFSSKIIKLPLQTGVLSEYPDLEISYVSIGDKLKIVALSGEIFSEYSLWLRGLLSHKEVDFLAVGYCNDMVGYIPTLNAIQAGGYEVERVFSDFSHPSPFSVRIEGMIKKEIKILINMSTV